ncbi:MAG: MATE family efflux transporter [Marinifilaceae bacterium]
MPKLINKILREKNIQSVSSNVLGAAINFATFLLLVRSLSPENFGQWVIFITAATLIDMLRFGLTRRAITHYATTSSETEAISLKASGFGIDLALSLIIALVCLLINLLFSSFIGSSYQLFFLYYPILVLANLCWNNSLAIQQALQKFDRILYIRFIVSFLFFLFVVINKIWVREGIEVIIIGSILSNALASIFTVTRKWTGLHLLFRSRINTIKKILNYGKFTLLTSVGSSLLKSADALIIGLSPVLGANGVALYAIPFKVVDFIQLPLNGLMTAAIPKLSKTYLNRNTSDFKSILYSYTGASILFLIPYVIVLALLSYPVLYIFGGKDYLVHMPTMEPIFFVILGYSLLLPLDRFSGAALDSAGIPHRNAQKVYVMLILNLIGDFIAVFYFESLLLTAIVTVIFTIVGMVLGWNFLNRQINVKSKAILTEGIEFYRNLLIQYKKN